MYTRQLAQAILIRLHERQWNPYLSNHILRVGRDSVICQGPAQRLVVKGSYILFPRISHSNSPQEVIGALDILVAKLTEAVLKKEMSQRGLPVLQELPSISLQGRQHTLEGFTFHPESVKTYTPTGLVVSYEDFFKGLATLVRGVT